MADDEDHSYTCYHVDCILDGVQRPKTYKRSWVDVNGVETNVDVHVLTREDGRTLHVVLLNMDLCLSMKTVTTLHHVIEDDQAYSV